MIKETASMENAGRNDQASYSFSNSKYYYDNVNEKSVVSRRLTPTGFVWVKHDALSSILGIDSHDEPGIGVQAEAASKQISSWAVSLKQTVESTHSKTLIDTFKVSFQMPRLMTSSLQTVFGHSRSTRGDQLRRQAVELANEFVRLKGLDKESSLEQRKVLANRISSHALEASEFAASPAAQRFPARCGAHYMIAFHGTSEELANRIALSGIARPLCRQVVACSMGQCDCEMEGYGVYLADHEKAAHYASRRANFDKNKRGGVIAFLVDIGHCKVGLPEPCKCGCVEWKGRGNPNPVMYLDHAGRWYTNEGFDTLYLRDNSMPATRAREWCVADPARCLVLGVESTDENGNFFQA
jgi:hypothetical protein